MENNYWVYEDYFIFKPKFNGLITDYHENIMQYNKLIFSNYDNLESIISIIQQKNYEPPDYNCSKFNKPLLNSLDKLINLRCLTFGYWFNKQLLNSLDKLINLTN